MNIRLKSVSKETLSRCSTPIEKFHKLFAIDDPIIEDDLSHVKLFEDLDEIENDFNLNSLEPVPVTTFDATWTLISNFCNACRQQTSTEQYEEEMQDFIQKAHEQIRNKINDDIYHHCSAKIKAFYEWSERKIPGSSVYTGTPLVDRDPSLFKLTFYYEDKISEMLTFDPRYLTLACIFIVLWNVKMWIRLGGDDMFVYNIIQNTMTSMDELDRDCPVFYKYYRFFVINGQSNPRNGKNPLPATYLKTIEIILNTCIEKTVKYAKTKDLLMTDPQYRNIFGQFNGNVKRATDMQVNQTIPNEITIHLKKPTIKNGVQCEEMDSIKYTYHGRFIDLIKINTLIYNTALFVKCFNDFDPKVDICEEFERICDKLQDSL